MFRPQQRSGGSRSPACGEARAPARSPPSSQPSLPVIDPSALQPLSRTRWPRCSGSPHLVARDPRPIPVIDLLQLTTDPIDDDTLTVVDAGRVDQLPAATDDGVSLVVVRGPCYLALRSLASIGGPRPDGIVLVREAGRSLTAGDVADIAGVAVIAQVDVTSTVARTIDAGLLISRLHRLDELAPLRHWTARQLTSRRRAPARSPPPRPPC